ncbi:TRAP transporter small permease [Roseibium salinum]|nr:TRAP transporter small permease [Roseibium salinum]
MGRGSKCGNGLQKASAALNFGVEAIIAILMALLVLDVWLGVVDRYFFHWQLPWPEILARYLMIWAAMLAVSSGIARRDHIGLTAAIMRIPAPLRRAVLVVIDLCTLALFLYVFWYGLGFCRKRRHPPGDDLRRQPAALPCRHSRCLCTGLRADGSGDDPGQRHASGPAALRGGFGMIVAAVFIGLILLGMPIGFAIGAAGVVGLIDMGGAQFLAVGPSRIFNGLNIFPFLAMPFFSSWPARS